MKKTSLITSVFLVTLILLLSLDISAQQNAPAEKSKRSTSVERLLDQLGRELRESVAAGSSTYEDARKSLESEGGYLLPYRRQYFVCESEVISAIGLGPDDFDWEKIGWDGARARPADVQAYERLREKREQAVLQASGR